MLEVQKRLHIFGRSGPSIYGLSAVDIALWDIAGKAANALCPPSLFSSAMILRHTQTGAQGGERRDPRCGAELDHLTPVRQTEAWTHLRQGHQSLRDEVQKGVFCLEYVSGRRWRCSLTPPFRICFAKGYGLRIKFASK